MNKHKRAIYGRLFAAFVLVAVALVANASGYFADVGSQRSAWVKNTLTPAVVTPVFEVPTQVKPVYEVVLNITAAGHEPEAQARCRSPGNATERK